MALRLLLLAVFVFVVEAYAYQVVRVLTKLKWVRFTYISLSAVLLAGVFFVFSQHDRTSSNNELIYSAIGLLLMLLVPKLVISLFLLIEDLFRLLFWLIKVVSRGYFFEFVSFNRRRGVSLLALTIALIPFFGFVHGILVGKYNYQVRHQQVFFKDLPQTFDGFKILQISDIHVGSFKDPKEVMKGINLINAQDYDVLVFTGDIINNLAKEFDGWEPVFNQIKRPKYGKYSVIGNHDFGDYYPWGNDAIAKAKNFENMTLIHPKIGMKLLRNNHVWIEKDGEKIAIVGIDNWGYRFHQVGDLEKALKPLVATDFKVLLSHDPSHWEYQAKMHPKNIQLTLSGHTHGMQFGIDIDDYFKWSPVQYVYKQWAGLYEEDQKKIYVNRGFGFHAYPGRVGVFPEITVIELKVAK